MAGTNASLDAGKLSVLVVEVNDLDKDLKEVVTSYNLVMDFNAIAKAKELLGRDLSRLDGWNDISGPDLSVICWCAFDRFYPDLTLQQVRRMLSPAKSGETFNALLELTFPGILARIAEAEAKAKAKEQQPQGEALPAAAGGP